MVNNQINILLEEEKNFTADISQSITCDAKNDTKTEANIIYKFNLNSPSTLENIDKKIVNINNSKKLDLDVLPSQNVNIGGENKSLNINHFSLKENVINIEEEKISPSSSSSRPEVWDLTQEELRNMLKRLESVSEQKGEHRVMTKYRGNRIKRLKEISYRGIKLTASQWFFICSYGFYDNQMYYLQQQCEEEFCYIHFYCVSRSTRNRIDYFEWLTAHDHILAIEWIRKNSAQDNESGCWLWTGSLNSQGYGIGTFLNRFHHIHRFNYQLQHLKTLPDNILVLHDPILCKHRSCLKLSHLREGTATDNTQDMIIAGTMCYGEDHHSAKYSNDQIDHVKQLIKDTTQTNVKIGYQTNTNAQIASNVRRTGKRSRHRKNGAKRERKFTHEEIRYIRKFYDNTKKNRKKLSLKYNVNEITIRAIIDKKSYKDVQATEAEQKEYTEKKWNNDLTKLKERLEKKVKKESSGCWLWQAGMNGLYGWSSFQYRHYGAHVLSYMAWNNNLKPIPKGQVVRHVCPGKPEPTCINPAHLLIGSSSDNAKDAFLAGTNRICEKNRKWDIDLKNEIIEQLRKKKLTAVTDMYEPQGFTYSQIARIYYWAKEKNLL